MEFWTPLPEHFKKSVIKKLDYRSRCRFRKCSKLDRFLVDSFPIFLDHVDIQPRIGEELYFGIGETSDTDTFLCDKAYNIKEALEDFLSIFKNPKSEIRNLTITYECRRNSEVLHDFFDSLLLLVEDSLKLKIKEIIINNYTQIQDVTFLNFLKGFDSTSLKCICLYSFPEYTADMLERIVETEQWRNLEVIQIRQKSWVPLEHFLHANSCCVYFERFNGRDSWRCIQKYRSKPHPFPSFFQVFTNEELEMDEIFSFFDVPVRDQPLEARRRPDIVSHTQHFPVSWSQEYLLIVKNGRVQIEGAICRKESLLADFNQLESD